MQRTGPFTNAVFAALQAARCLTRGLLCPKRQVDLLKMADACTRGEFIRLPASRCVSHLLKAGVRQVWPYRLAVPELRLLTGGALAAGFRRVIQYGGRRRGKHLCRTIFDAGRALWARVAKIAFMRRGFTLSFRGVTTISIVPNGQATTQALQPMHFVDSPVRCHRIC